MSSTLDGYDEYRAFMDKLAVTNVDKYIDLPMIAVMGDTSSGKSSLLSSISMIELPSSDELTTRCPIMLRMNRADKRTAMVEVKWKDLPKGKTEDEIAFDPQFVDESNWADLTKCIAAAQLHIIKSSGKEVARDVVSVKVASPHCEDLTLIDLPGIVRSTGAGESATLAEDIQSLIDDYLKNPRCIILAVHPANNDFHNSQIMADAKKVDPLTKRTLPVLTKPDIIDSGAETAVRDLLLGRKTDAFEKGFHMVKGRGQAALNKNETIESNLQAEASFFRNTQPWRDVEDRSLFGIPSLRRKLGDLQMHLVRDTFPSIVTEMKEEKIKSTDSLSLLAEAPSSTIERRLFFYEAKDRLVRAIRSHLSGSNVRDADDSKSSDTCSSLFHGRCKEFMDALHQGKLADISAIKVGVKATYTYDKQEYADTIAWINKDQVYFKGCVLEENAGKYTGNSVFGNVFFDASDNTCCLESSNSMYDLLRPIPLSKVRRDPDWIRDLITKNRPYTLPIFMNTDVFEQILSECMENEWRGPCLDLVASVSILLRVTVSGSIRNDRHISRFERLTEFLIRRVDEVADEMIPIVKEKVVDFIRREKVPYTQNHYLNENLSRLRSKRLEEGLREALSGSGDNIPRSTVNAAITSVFQRNQKMSVDEHMADDMQHALDAYGKVALKRFIDVVPMTCGDVLLDFPDKFNACLLHVSDQELEKLISLPHDVITKRVNLKRKLDDLNEGLKVFNELF